MNYLNSSAIIFLKVIESGKAPDLRYITVGTSDLNKSDNEFANSAVAYFKESSDYPSDAVFNLKAVHRFQTREEYLKFFETQLDNYLNQ